MKSLAPILPSFFKHALSDPHLSESLEMWGDEPLFLFSPKDLSEMIEPFERVFKKAQLPYKMFISQKPAFAPSILREVSEKKSATDVSSVHELLQAIKANIAPEQIMASGVKNVEYLRTAAMAGVLIACDSLEELLALKQILETEKRQGNVLLRLSCNQILSKVGFESRFGINQEELTQCFQVISSAFGSIKCLGFAFHLNHGSTTQRVRALEYALTMYEEFSEFLSFPTYISIGGGFRVSSTGKETWSEFFSRIKHHLKQGDEQVSWSKSGLGIEFVDGHLRGRENFVAPSPEVDAEQELSALLSTRLSAFGESKVFEVLKDYLITLIVEPGRSVLQPLVAYSAKVQHVKLLSSGDKAVFLNGNTKHINASENHLILDPIHIRAHDHLSPSTHAYVFGNLCLESDIFSQRRFFFLHSPVVGDRLVFTHVGAYAAGFSVGRPHSYPEPRRVCLYPEGEGFCWAEEDKAGCNFEMRMYDN